MRLTELCSMFPWFMLSMAHGIHFWIYSEIAGVDETPKKINKCF